MLKFIVEGFSQDSVEGALADAMAKAAAHMSENHDVNIAILELAELPGRGYRAVLEITVVPMSHRKTLHREAADMELKHLQEHDYRARRKHDEEHLKQMVLDHFALTIGNLCPDIPDFYTAHLNDAMLLNKLIEKEFLHAARPAVDIPHREKGVPPLKQVLGKPLKPEPEA